MTDTDRFDDAARSGAAQRVTARVTLARLRIGSGLVLFAFVLAHLLNHAVGLVSLDWMQAGQDLRLPLTRSPPGMVVLLTASVVHLGLGLWTLLHLRTWRVGLRNLAQLILGLLIPVMLIRHVIGTRGVKLMFGIDDDYTYALWVMWPGEAWNQAILISLVWVHGCFGLHRWLSAKPWYSRSVWLWYGLAVLIPVLSYAGFVEAARLHQLQSDDRPTLTGAQYADVLRAIDLWGYGYLALIGAAAVVWAGLLAAHRLSPRVTVRYAHGPTVVAPRGMTLLDISRMNRIPHASVCGGKARCSTCRVRVVEGLDQLPAAGASESQVLRRVGAPANVRLACQLRPTADLQISTLLPAAAETARDLPDDKYFWGVEQEVTLLFCDLRGFTRMSEGRLSFDVVFLLNQFLGRMAEAIEDTGGFVDKFMGDGIMAIFGMDMPVEEGAARALAAARAMGGVLDSLNQSLRDELRVPLSMGIGIHTGPAILGRIGAAQRGDQVARLTALGETVNIASRLESQTKDLGVQVAVSARTQAASGLAPTAQMTEQAVLLRGLSQPIAVFTAPRAIDLPGAPAPAAATPA